jgi:hypothetical protein
MKDLLTEAAELRDRREKLERQLAEERAALKERVNTIDGLLPRGPGRPTKPEEEARPCVFTLRLTRAERQMVADAAGLFQHSAWARRVLVDAARAALAPEPTPAPKPAKKRGAK